MPRSRTLSLALSVTLVGALAGLAGPAFAQDQDTRPEPPEATPNPVALESPAGDGTGVRLTTDLGDIVIGLFNLSAPVAAENFLNLARLGFYDGVGFHRVAPGFVLQGGDPEGTGAGGPGYTIRDEEVVGEYGRGIVAMARARGPDSQGSQFFVVLDDSAKRSLDAVRTYVIFGRVIEGMDVVDAIVERGPASGHIEDPVRIISASVEQVELPPEPTPPPPTVAEIAAEALATRLPAEVAGIELAERAIFTSDVIRAQTPSETISELADAAEAHGSDLEHLAIARASGEDGEAFATILAISIDGVPADQVLAPMASLVLGPGAISDATDETIGGRGVKRIELAPDQVAYLLASDDIVWLVVADEDSLEDVVSAIP